jgi:hypothetical protein
VAGVWDRVRKRIDNSDNVLVLNVTSDSYAGWLPQEAWDWIYKKL